MGIIANKTLQSRSVAGIILILAPLIFSFAITLDIYVPSIPEVKLYFGVDQDVMQLTISLFLLTTGIAQLLIGPVADQIGRRKIVLASILLLVTGSLVCMVSTYIAVLIIGRIIQAFGACGMMVSCFSIVRDLFAEEECARIYSFLNATIALSPLLAPLVGGYLAYWLNWRASFAFLALVGILIFFSAWFNINETLRPEDARNLTKGILKDYYQIIKHPEFMIYTFCAAAGFAGFLTFFSSSSFIIIRLLHVPEQHFGFYFAILGVIFFIGSLLSGHCVRHFSTYKTVLAGAFLMFLGGLIMLAWYKDFGLSLSGFIMPMMIMGIGGAFLMGAGAGGAISPFPKMAATASALFGCIQFVFAFFVSQVVMEWHVNSTVPLSYTLILLGFLAFAVTIVKSV